MADAAAVLPLRIGSHGERRARRRVRGAELRRYFADEGRLAAPISPRSSTTVRGTSSPIEITFIFGQFFLREAIREWSSSFKFEYWG